MNTISLINLSVLGFGVYSFMNSEIKNNERIFESKFVNWKLSNDKFLLEIKKEN